MPFVYKYKKNVSAYIHVSSCANSIVCFFLGWVAFWSQAGQPGRRRLVRLQKPVGWSAYVSAEVGKPFGIRLDSLSAGGW